MLAALNGCHPAETGVGEERHLARGLKLNRFVLQAHPELPLRVCSPCDDRQTGLLSNSYHMALPQCHLNNPHGHGHSLNFAWLESDDQELS